jgi:ubiquinone/menaquinone biosynthesis C-methylase UbiE
MNIYKIMNIFDKYARNYDLWYEEPFGKSAFKLELDCINKILNYTNKSIFSYKSLEIGVGSGRFAQDLKITYGIDTSIELLKLAKKKGVLGILGKAENLPFKNSSFDLVLIVVSICFFENPELALKQVWRILKEDGNLVIGLILSESLWAKFYKEKAKKGHPIYSNAHFYSYSELNSMLIKNNFKIEKIYSTLFENPQDQKPIENRAIKEGFYKEGGFFCIIAKKSHK